MKKFSVRRDGHDDGEYPVVATNETQCDTLAESLEIVAELGHRVHVVHEPTGLQLHQFGKEQIWRDEYGKECPPPRDCVQQD